MTSFEWGLSECRFHAWPQMFSVRSCKRTWKWFYFHREAFPSVFPSEISKKASSIANAVLFLLVLFENSTPHARFRETCSRRNLSIHFTARWGSSLLIRSIYLCIWSFIRYNWFEQTLISRYPQLIAGSPISSPKATTQITTVCIPSTSFSLPLVRFAVLLQAIQRL